MYPTDQLTHKELQIKNTFDIYTSIKKNLLKIRKDQYVPPTYNCYINEDVDLIRHQKSILYRLLDSFDAYFKKWKFENNTLIYTGESQYMLQNKEHRNREYRLLFAYVHKMKKMLKNQPIFEDHVTFLWNFFIFLHDDKRMMRELSSLEYDEKRYVKFENKIRWLYTKFPDILNKKIQHELNQTQKSDTKVRFVLYIMHECSIQKCL